MPSRILAFASACLSAFFQTNGSIEPGHSGTSEALVKAAGIKAKVDSVRRDPNQPNYEWVQISVRGPADFVITDPLGRRVGFDPIDSVSYSEIPTAQYTLEGGIGDIVNGTEKLDDSKSLYFRVPIPGTYKFKMIGTGMGAYEVDMSSSNTLGTRIHQQKSLQGTAFVGKSDTGSIGIATDTILYWRLDQIRPTKK